MCFPVLHRDLSTTLLLPFPLYSMTNFFLSTYSILIPNSTLLFARPSRFDTSFESQSCKVSRAEIALLVLQIKNWSSRRFCELPRILRYTSPSTFICACTHEHTHMCVHARTHTHANPWGYNFFIFLFNYRNTMY